MQSISIAIEQFYNGNFKFPNKLKPLRNRKSTFINDILLLATGIRCCYLLDYANPDLHSLRSFVNDLKKSFSPLLDEIEVLSLDGLLFFINKQKLDQRTQISSLHSYLQFINVSKKLSEPQICKEEALINTCKQLNDFCSKLSKRLEQKQFDTSCENVIYGPSASGWLLEYPFIYFNDEQRANENCLSMVSLNVYKVIISNIKGDDHTAMSFSIPSELDDDGVYIETFKKELHKRLEAQVVPFWKEVKLESASITLPHIML